jgi:DNA polymerase III alpha subunit (gram-positive type)
MIIFDLETTGLPKAEGSDLDMQPRIIEFGGIKVDDDFNKIDSLEFLCNPGHLLDPKIIKITKITDDMLKNQDPFIARYRHLVEWFCGETSMAAHNLSFDRQILKFELERIDKLTKFPWPYNHICTVEIGQSIWGKMKKLGDIYEELFDKKIEGAHRSLVDVEATIEILRWYRKEGHI